MSIALAIAAASLFIPALCWAADETPAVNAAMTVFGYIISVDAMIERCRRSEPASAPVYDRLYADYHARVNPTIFTIRFLLSEAARRSGVDKDFLPGLISKLSDEGAAEIDRTAKTNPGTFAEICRTLPKALAAGIPPFTALRERWPAEMRLIEDWR